jgi:Ca-activated chloride channel homolog
VTTSTLVSAWPGLAAVALAIAAAALVHRAGGSVRAAMLRGTIVLLVGLALAAPVLARGTARGALVLADRSAAVAPGAVDRALTGLGLAAARVGVLPFGAPGGPTLAGALDRAGRALPDGGRLVVVTSGAGVDGTAVVAAARAAQAGVAVDVLSVPGRPGLDAAVTGVAAPERWRGGDAVPVVVTVRANGPVRGRVVLDRDGALAATAPVTGSAGVASVRLSAAAPVGGVARWRARVEVPGDVDPSNDVGAAATRLLPPPRVLVVGDGASAVLLADALGRRGLAATVAAPDRLPGRLSELAEWDVLALVDVPAAAMGLEQQAAVAAFATTLGGGVLLVGGRQSFLPGGWAGTPLAALSPLDLEPPPRDQHEAVALLLMIDQSASMGSSEGPAGRSKLALAREAATLAAESLHPGDTLGVVAYDDAARWLVPLQPVAEGGGLAGVADALGGLTTGGGTHIGSALELGLPALAGLAVPTRHAVLLTDGRDFNPDASAYEALVRQARAAGVTLSTIALGSDADRALLTRLAAVGRGRFHTANDPADLPRLAVQESETVRARSEQSGRFRAMPASPDGSAELAGVDMAALPELTGYLATTARPAARVVALAPNGDPLLATWQYGLGRVTAWASDSGEEWASAWAPSWVADTFWARLVRYVAPLTVSAPLTAAVDRGPGGLRITVDAVGPAGLPMDLADATLLVTDTAGARTVPLAQMAPGRYVAELAAEGAGPVVAAARVDGPGWRWFTDVFYGSGASPASWPRDDDPRRLAQLAAAGGGRVLSAPGPLAVAAPGALALWPWLLALAALLWPLDVARHMGWPRRRRPELAAVQESWRK